MATCERSHAPNCPLPLRVPAPTVAAGVAGRRRAGGAPASRSAAGPSCFRRGGVRPGGRLTETRRVYLTVTVFAAEVLDALEWVTRTRTLYLPLAAEPST